MYSDDEATEFEMSPLGARQRLLPSRTFVSRIPPHVPAALQAPDYVPPAMETGTQPLLLLPPEIHYPDAVDEIISSSSSTALPEASSIGLAAAMPIASRRFRWLAVPLVSLLALGLLGGALWHPNEVQAPSIAPSITAADEDIRPGAEQLTAAEDPAPDDEEPQTITAKPARAKRIAKPVVRPAAKRIAKHRTVTVNSSSALGNLRPRKAW